MTPSPTHLGERERLDGPDLVPANWEGMRMARIALTCCFAALLASCVQSYQQADWGRARLACADVGLEPQSAAFDDCVFDLYYTVWDQHYAGER
jgi:hypothetical protein